MAATVTVGNRLPYGLVLRAFAMEPVSRPVVGGAMKEFVEARATGRIAVVAGTQSPVPPGEDPPLIVAGAAMTPGIDADLWNEWFKQNQNEPYVTERLVFAHEKPDAVSGVARENRGRRTGIEPLDPGKLPAGIQPWKP